VAASAAGNFVVTWSQYNFETSATGVVGRVLGDAPLPCAPTPMTECREPTIPGRGVFRFRHGGPRTRSLVWRWVRGQAADPEDFGDPFTTDSYALCVYDASASPQPLLETGVPAGGACGAIPCWQTLSGQRIHYFDQRLGFVEGLRLIRMTPGIDGRTRVAVRARGEALELPPVPLTPPVTVQIQVSNGECWSAAYSTFIRRNDAGVFKASPGSPSGAFLDIAPNVVE
jgi:hypothetical protein